MPRLFALIFSFFVICSSLTGCAALASALPVIDTALSDATLVLKGIESSYDAYQTQHPVSPQDRAEYDLLIANAYKDLRLGERAVADAKQIDQKQYDQAFGDFEVAFKALADYLKAKGITPIGTGLVGEGQQGDTFPTPRIIGLKIQS
jgi:hypothetical protein